MTPKERAEARFIWVVYAIIVAIGIGLAEWLLPLNHWWEHIIVVIIALWAGCGAIGGAAEPESDTDVFDPYP